MALNVVDNVVGGNLNGSGADDLLIGSDGAGGDVISGNGGDDVIRGNGGFDIIFSGSGNDTLVVGADDGTLARFQDFEVGSDVLDFSNLNVDAGDVQIVQGEFGGTDVIVSGAQTVNLGGLDPNDIDIQEDFVFAG